MSEDKYVQHKIDSDKIN